MYSLFYKDIHFHSDIEIVWIKEGKILCQVENNNIPLENGQILFNNENLLDYKEFQILYQTYGKDMDEKTFARRRYIIKKTKI